MYTYLAQEKLVLFKASSANRSSTKMQCSPQPCFSLDGGKSIEWPCMSQNTGNLHTGAYWAQSGSAKMC